MRNWMLRRAIQPPGVGSGVPSVSFKGEAPERGLLRPDPIRSKSPKEIAMHSNDFGSKPTTASQVPPHAQEKMRELAAHELHAIGGGRTYPVNPDILTDRLPPPREQT
jgi:hypothetical protein